MQAELEAYLADWRKNSTALPDHVPVEIQIGDLSEMRREQGVNEDHVGVTLSPDNKQFILAFDEAALAEMTPEKREHVLLHELMHARLGFYVGDDPIEQMEAAVDMCAELLFAAKKGNV